MGPPRLIRGPRKIPKANHMILGILGSRHPRSEEDRREGAVKSRTTVVEPLASSNFPGLDVRSKQKRRCLANELLDLDLDLDLDLQPHSLQSCLPRLELHLQSTDRGQRLQIAMKTASDDCVFRTHYRDIIQAADDVRSLLFDVDSLKSSLSDVTVIFFVVGFEDGDPL
ncbi:hypothetical protein ACLB2K_000183 [Fragaria x ananassa]